MDLGISMFKGACSCVCDYSCILICRGAHVGDLYYCADAMLGTGRTRDGAIQHTRNMSFDPPPPFHWNALPVILPVRGWVAVYTSSVVWLRIRIYPSNYDSSNASSVHVS
jgi:hypothetical protein